MKYRTRSSVGAVKDVVEKIIEKEIPSEIETMKSTNNENNSDPVVKHFIRQEIDVPRMWGNVVENDIIFVVNNRELVETSRSVMCLTSNLMDMLVSLFPCCTTVTIMVPDYSVTDVKNLLLLLTSGVTVENTLDKHQVSQIKSLGKDLGIDMSSLAASNQYYEIVDTSENNGEQPDERIIQDDSSTIVEVKSSILLTLSSNLTLDSCSENLPSSNHGTKSCDDNLGDFLDDDVEEFSFSAPSNIQLNNTCSSETPTGLVLTPLEEEEIGEDFEFDEEYPEEDGWDVDTEIRKEEKDGGIVAAKSDNLKKITDQENFDDPTNKDDSKEVSVKVSSLHGMIDTFLSSFKDGSGKSFQGPKDVLEESNVATTLQMKSTEINDQEPKVKEPDSKIAGSVQEGNESANFCNDSATDSSTLLLGDSPSKILVDGKYKCMFCESVYTQARGLFTHCSSEHFHDEIKVKFGNLIVKGNCTLCPKKVKGSRVSHHLGAVHKKVNEMLEELGLPPIPNEESKTVIPADDAEEDVEQYIPRSTRSRSAKQEVKCVNRSPQKMEELKSEVEAKTVVKLKTVDKEPEVNPEIEGKAVDKEPEVNSEVEWKTVVKSKTVDKERKGVLQADSISVEDKVGLKILKLPSRLKISQVTSTSPNHVNKSKESKELKLNKKVLFRSGEKDSREKVCVPVPIDKKVTKLEQASISEVKQSNSKNVGKNPIEKVAPITLKFGKGSSVKKDLKITPIGLPKTTTIRFENDEKENVKKKKNEGTTISNSDEDYSRKKLEIRTNLEKIEAQLKDFEKCTSTEVICQEQNVVKVENSGKMEGIDEKKEIHVVPGVIVDEKDDHVLIKDIGPQEEKNEPNNTSPEVVDVPEPKRNEESENELNVSPDNSLYIKKDGDITQPKSDLGDNSDIHKEQSSAVNEDKYTTNQEETSSHTESTSTVEVPVNYFNCPLCIYIVDKKITLREHLSIVHYKTILLEMFSESNIKCTVCKKAYSNENHLARHIGSNHKKLKEITTVHSKVYSVDNSKAPSMTDTYPCLVCMKCKAITCMRCIACMEIKSNPKVTESVCFKKRCGSPISEAEFQVMKLTSATEIVPNNETIVKMESDQIEIKMEPEELTFGTMESFVIKTEVTEDTHEASMLYKEHIEEEPLSISANITNDDINADIKEPSDNPITGCLEEPLKKLGDANGTDVVINENVSPSPAFSAEGGDTKDELRKVSLDSEKKRKIEDSQIRASKRLKSAPNQESNKFLDISSLSRAETNPPLVEGTLLTNPAIPKEEPPEKEPLKKQSTSMDLKTSVTTLTQLKTALKSPSVMEPVTEENHQAKPPEGKVANVLHPKSDIQPMAMISKTSSQELRCFKCSELFSSRSILYEHYSVKHFYSHIIKTFKPQDTCPIPSCNVTISRENIWVSHVGAKHNIVEGFIPKEHRISASLEKLVERSTEQKEVEKPKPTKPKPVLKTVPAQSSKMGGDEVTDRSSESNGSYRWWQDLGGDLLKGAAKKQDKISQKVSRSKHKQVDSK